MKKTETRGIDKPLKLSLEDENNLLKMQIAELKNLIVNLCLEERRSFLPKP